jgi:hypothetical protein
LIVALRCAGYLFVALKFEWPSWLIGDKANRLSQSCLMWGKALLHFELAVLASLIWSREHWRQTLGSLVTLPLTLEHLFRLKLRGAALAVLPSVLLIALGFVLDPSGLIAGFQAYARGAITAQGLGTGMATVAAAGRVLIQVGSTVFFLILVINASLRMRWAALPVAYFIAVVLELIIALVPMSFLLRNAFLGQTAYSLANVGFGLLYLAAAYVIYRNTRSLLLHCAAEA